MSSSRRAFLTTLSAGVAGCLSRSFDGPNRPTISFSGEPSAVSTAGAWPTPMHDHANTGSTVGHPFSPGELSKAWAYDVDSNQSDLAVADGTAYFTEWQPGSVGAIDVDTGEELWFLEDALVGGPFTPTVHGEFLVVPTDSDVAVVDRTEAEVVWVSDNLGEATAPRVHDDSLVVAFPGRIEARDVATGSIDWRHDFASEEIEPAGSPAVTSGRVYLTTVNDELRCLDASSGHEVWKHSVPGTQSESAPAIVGDQIYLNTESGLQRRNTDDGSITWQSELVDGRFTPVVAPETVVSGLRNDRTGYLVAYDRPSMEPRWRVETKKIYDQYTIAGNIVVAGLGSEIAFDTATGEPVLSTDRPIRGGKVAADSFLTYFDGQFMAFES